MHLLMDVDYHISIVHQQPSHLCLMGGRTHQYHYISQTEKHIAGVDCIPANQLAAHRMAYGLDTPCQQCPVRLERQTFAGHSSIDGIAR